MKNPKLKKFALGCLLPLLVLGTVGYSFYRYVHYELTTKPPRPVFEEEKPASPKAPEKATAQPSAGKTPPKTETSPESSEKTPQETAPEENGPESETSEGDTVTETGEFSDPGTN